MRLPSFNLTFELIRSNANMDFDVFCKYIQSRMERMPKHFIVQPDGISFGISCESAANIIEACETVSVLFQKEHLVDVQYYATPNYNLLSIDPTSYYTLLVSGNEADLDDSKSKVNGFSSCLCADCKMPDFNSIKLPFLINEKYRKKIQRHKYLLRVREIISVTTLQVCSEISNSSSHHGTRSELDSLFSFALA